MYNMQKLPEQPILGNMIRTYSNILKTRTNQVTTATSLKYEKRASWHSEVPIIAGGKHHQTSWNLLIKWILMLTLSKAHFITCCIIFFMMNSPCFPIFSENVPIKTCSLHALQAPWTIALALSPDSSLVKEAAMAPGQPVELT